MEHKNEVIRAMNKYKSSKNINQKYKIIKQLIPNLFLFEA